MFGLLLQSLIIVAQTMFRYWPSLIPDFENKGIKEAIDPSIWGKVKEQVKEREKAQSHGINFKQNGLGVY